MKKEIKGFENYTVNDCGDNERTIYNEIRCKYKKPQQYKNGYFFVSLFKNGKKQNVSTPSFSSRSIHSKSRQ